MHQRQNLWKMWSLVALVSLVPLALAWSEGPVVLTPDAEGIQRADLHMESYAFTPAWIEVQSGTPVELTLVNDSFLIPHNFLLDSPDGRRLVEVNVGGGEETTVRFSLTEPGTYPFYCDKAFLFFPNHREEGMEGRILVR